MRPGCIFVSHRSMLIWFPFFCFFVFIYRMLFNFGNKTIRLCITFFRHFLTCDEYLMRWRFELWRHQQCSPLPGAAAALSVQLFFIFYYYYYYSHDVLFRLLSACWIYLFNMRNPKMFFHMYSFWGFWCTFFTLCYIILMVNGYISLDL